MKNWFIVQSHSNFENKVAGLIKEEAEKAKIPDKFEKHIAKSVPLYLEGHKLIASLSDYFLLENS